MSNEILLPLKRQLTDKEKNCLLWQKNRKLEARNANLVKEINKLTIKNKKLADALKEETGPLPSGNDCDTVSARAYRKLMRRCKMFEDRVWELIEERRKLLGHVG